MKDLTEEHQKAQDQKKECELVTQLIKEEMQTFAGNGIVEVKEDVLKFVVHRRRQIEHDTALLDLIHRGIFTIELADPEDMESANIIMTEKGKKEMA